MPGTNGHQLRGHTETIGQRMERDLDALLPLPAVPYDACDKQRVSSLSLVRYRTSDYSVPVAFDSGRPGTGLRGPGGDQLRTRPPGIPDHTNATTSSMTPSTTCRSWNGSREPWIRPLRYRDGTSPRSSGRCADCWSHGTRGSVSMYRCKGSWRL